jgi:hypothetical protein
LLALLPALRAGAAGSRAKAAVLVLPGVVFSGPEGSGARLAELLAQELRGTKVVTLPPHLPAKSQGDLGAQARAMLGKASDLGKKGKHAQAAEALQKAIAQLTARPLLLDEPGGKLLSDALLRLAVERMLAGDDEGGEKALSQLVRLSPERELAAADYPPAFLRQLDAVRKRLLGEPRGSLRVLAAPGSGEARVLLDGRALRDAPVLIRDVIPGEHFVRVERGSTAWATRVIAIAGAESRVAPQPGVEGPVAELSAALMQDEFDRAAAYAGSLARETGAQAAVFGVVARTGDSLSLRSFLTRGDRVLALTPLTLNVELLGAAVELARLADEIQKKLDAPPPEASVSVSFAALAGEIPEVQGAPPPPAPEGEVPLAPLVSEAPPPASPPEPARRVALPGAPVSPTPPAPEKEKNNFFSPAPDSSLVVAAPKTVPAPEPPSRALVIPRQPTRDEGEAPPQAAKPRPPPAPEKRIAALEPDAIKTIREPPPEKKNHTLLWILAGTLLAGGLAAGGYYLYQQNQTPSSSAVTVSWTH